MTSPLSPSDPDNKTPLRDELIFGNEDLIGETSDNEDIVDEDVREAQEINRHLHEQ